MKLIFEKSVAGRRGVGLPKCDVPKTNNIPDNLKRAKLPDLPEVSELDVIRHYTKLSHNNIGVDTNFYPLGSCTMKYNPKICEEVSRYEGFTQLHPLMPQLLRGGMLTQGALQVLFDMQELLAEITGMDNYTMQPMAGAHGELTGLMIIAAYHKHKGNKKTKVIIPDSAHGTNPASAAIAGYNVISIPSDKDGEIDLELFEKALDDEVAAVMLTCPNTLGLFNKDIKKISDMTHAVDGLMYYDGANLNAILGKVKPGDVGFDVVHINLHKSFATPHGGGGPGAGPVGVKKHLKDFLPISRIVKRNDGTYGLSYGKPLSIGYIAPFYGNFGVVLKAYAYILLTGASGLIRVSENAVLNANYMMKKLKEYYELPYDKTCMHEFVLSASKQKAKGIRALDIAKRLLDFGYHPPTIYFPMIVDESIMIEPTETESKETLDEFIDVMIQIAKEVDEDPQVIKDAPHYCSVGRLDEVKAAKDAKVRWVKN